MHFLYVGYEAHEIACHKWNTENEAIGAFARWGVLENIQNAKLFRLGLDTVGPCHLIAEWADGEFNLIDA